MSLPPPARELKVAMVQPSILQSDIWDPAGDHARFQSILDLSTKALASDPHLLLWPESAVPDLNPDIQQAIAQLLQKHHDVAVLLRGHCRSPPPIPTDRIF